MDISSVFDLIAEILLPRPRALKRFDTMTSVVLARSATCVRAPEQTLAPLPYANNLIRSAIYALKYYNHPRVPMLLAEVLSPFVAEELAERRMFGTFTAPLLIPVPLHPKRIQERGFNQALRIAQALHTQLNDRGIELAPTVLQRTVHLSSQTRHTRSERIKRLSGAFAVRTGEIVLGRDIILLDDVVTTGATLAAARTALMSAGAREVLCVAAAH